MDSENAKLVASQLGRALAVWGGGSVVAGAIAATTSSRPMVRAFGMQTAEWGAIDLAIAGVASRLRTPTSSKLRKILLVNVGLDVGYMLGGAYLVARRPRFGGRITADVARANGVAVVIQGAALLVLDTTHVRKL
ncbi:hypothetical protein C5142_22415 [Rhodococcus sp. BGS-1C]|uniref:DUF6992 family protein n=1 Tax=unclassified Rhodococcus (in: high G+C Gram-positive bacteria) TaxID=192944 RepID=UPI0019D28463|nr:hypothetical protein [Rhodococcus sp. KRD197]